MAAISHKAPMRGPVAEPVAAIDRPRQTPDHAAQAVEELGRRSLPGTAFHLAGLIFVELRMAGADHLPRALVIAVFASFLVARLVGYYMASRHLGSVGQRHAVLAIGAIGANAVWGVRTVAVQFAYPHVREKSLADVNKAIENTLIISSNETKHLADIETELGELPLVMCHGGEINQVILNIIVNAAHAIRDVVKDTGARGVIRVKTWADPEWVRIAISDTGIGIPAEILDKIFEPFFTTKPVGMGTGQGLAIARSVVVDKHGGTLDVTSQSGVGTTFTIGLPIR
jgi:hypothetical protein